MDICGRATLLSNEKEYSHSEVMCTYYNELTDSFVRDQFDRLRFRVEYDELCFQRR